MTAISTLGGLDQPPAGIWRRTTRALGKLWASVLAWPEAPARSGRQTPPPSEYYNYPPF